MSPEDVLKIQPDTPMDVAGAYWYESDAHSTPELFMKNLIRLLKEKGVRFILEQEVTHFKLKDNGIESVCTSKKDFLADEVVVTSGAWSEALLKQLGIQLSVQAGKGYRLNLNQPTGISLPALLLEAKVAVTPMQGFTRFGGTMELSGVNHKINSKRLAVIAQAGSDYYPQVQISQEELANVKCGLRPLSPDGLPFIGRHSKCKNLVLATGHSMMGWSLGPATGKLVAELISNQDTSISIKHYAPERKYGI